MEKFIPIIAILILVQFGMKFLSRRRAKQKPASRDFDYKKKIDDAMRISNYDEGVGTGRKLSEEAHQGLGGDLITGIPDNMRDVRKNLNLIIDGVSHGVKAKTCEKSDIMKYNNAAEMFDEIVEIINKHKV